MSQLVVWKPSQGALSRLVWVGRVADVDYWHERWSKQRLATAIGNARRHPILHDLFLHHSALGSRVLEGGCGLGQWVAILREHGRAVVGVDYDVATLHGTRDQEQGRALPLLGGDVRHLPFADGSFDTYISLGVAEHFFTGPAPLLAEARRVLRPGGTLLISVPYFSPLRRLRARLGTYQAATAGDLATEFYQFAFRPEEFAGLLAEAGFGVAAIIPFAATIGLYEEFPVVARWATTPEAGPAAEPPAPHREGRRPPRIAWGRGPARWLLHSRAARRWAGHMVLFVGYRTR